MNQVKRTFWRLRGRFWLFVKRKGWIRPDYTAADQGKDRVAPFDEYCGCDFCGSRDATEQMITMDKSRIVSCDACGLWFTNPRISEQAWVDYLRRETPRSIEFTENRLAYGVARSSNIRFTLP